MRGPLALFVFALATLKCVSSDAVNLERLHRRFLAKYHAKQTAAFVMQHEQVDFERPTEISLSNERGEAEVRFLKQPIDHFHPAASSIDTFQQRFVVNRDWYRAGQPIFSTGDSPYNFHCAVYVGGEAQLSPSSVTRGSIVTLAKQWHGLIVALEHRFYGVSQPFEDLSTDHLQYLSSLQALHDLAFFIQQLPALLSMPELETARWIIVGGSYPANLAAWFRQRFPHLVVGAWASSGPVLAKSDFFEYDQVVAQQLGAPCASYLRNVTDVLEFLLDHRSADGRDQLKNLFHEKMAAQVSDDTAFFYILADIISYAVQYDNPGTTFRSRMCQLDDDSRTGDSIEHFANFTHFFFQTMQIEPMDMDVASFTDPVLKDPSDNMRQWLWQSCTEFGYWQTAPTTGFSLRSRRISERWHLDNVCSGLFGFPKSHNVPTDITNTVYGGLRIQNATARIVFTNGETDPWKTLSVQAAPDRLASPSYLIHGAAHCSDLRTAHPSEPRSLTETRRRVIAEIGRWLREEGISP